MTTTNESSQSALRGKQNFRRLVPVVLLAPILSTSLGVDGGQIFQILATENLGLSAEVIGTALGLGVVSLPIQLRAARAPIHRARKNMQLFLVLASIQAWILAFLVAVGATGRAATLALGITVLAEINVSVLYAPSSQPLISRSVSATDRQKINNSIRAAAVAGLAVSVALFASISQPYRASFLVVVGLMGVSGAFYLRKIKHPADAAAPESSGDASIHRVTPEVKRIFVVLAIVALGAWPLFLIYTHEVLWPEANLGLIGAVQLLGPIVGLLAWRPTSGSVTIRARVAGLGIIGAALALALVEAPVNSINSKVVVVGAVFMSGLSITTIRASGLELAHRLTNDVSSVRTFTLLDVVASTSLQLGLWVSGFLIAASSEPGSFPIDAYRIYLLVFAVASFGPIMRLPSGP